MAVLTENISLSKPFIIISRRKGKCIIHTERLKQVSESYRSQNRDVTKSLKWVGGCWLVSAAEMSQLKVRQIRDVDTCA